jgi:hypothetical protein
MSNWRELLKGRDIAALTVKRHNVRHMRFVKGWPYTMKKYTEEENVAYKETKRLRKQPQWTVDRVGETISTSYFDKRQVRALVEEYTMTRNTHRFNRNIDTKKSLEFVKENKEYSMLRVSLSLSLNPEVQRNEASTCFAGPI